MKRWKAMVSLLCLAIWLPATQHCQLENLPGLGFLQCAGDTPGESDCQGDACDVVERGMYKVPDNADIIVIRVGAALLFEVPEVPPEMALGNGTADFLEVPEPARLDSWECYSSRALAIRGPSLLF